TATHSKSSPEQGRQCLGSGAFPFRISQSKVKNPAHGARLSQSQHLGSCKRGRRKIPQKINGLLFRVLNQKSKSKMRCSPLPLANRPLSAILSPTYGSAVQFHRISHH